MNRLSYALSTAALGIASIVGMGASNELYAGMQKQAARKADESKSRGLKRRPSPMLKAEQNAQAAKQDTTKPADAKTTDAAGAERKTALANEAAVRKSALERIVNRGHNGQCGAYTALDAELQAKYMVNGRMPNGFYTCPDGFTLVFDKTQYVGTGITVGDGTELRYQDASGKIIGDVRGVKLDGNNVIPVYTKSFGAGDTVTTIYHGDQRPTDEIVAVQQTYVDGKKQKTRNIPMLKAATYSDKLPDKKKHQAYVMLDEIISSPSGVINKGTLLVVDKHGAKPPVPIEILPGGKIAYGFDPEQKANKAWKQIVSDYVPADLQAKPNGYRR